MLLPLILIAQLAILAGIFVIYNKIPTKLEEPPRTGPEAAQPYLVSLEKAHAMVQEYRNPDRVPNNPEALCGWYPSGVFSSYEGHVINLASALNIEVTGIRFYYAAYLAEEEKNLNGFLKGAEKSHGGYQTLVFFPTTLKNGSHVGFDPVRSQDGLPHYIDDLFDGPEVNLNERKDTQFALLIQDGGAGGLNRAYMCPPNGDC